MIYKPNFEEFKKDLMSELNKFIKLLNLVLLKLKESPISNVNLLEQKVGFSENEIIKIVIILIKINKIRGALTKDNKQFLNKKEVLRRINLLKHQDRIKSIDELIIEAGFNKDSIESDLLQKIKYKANIKAES